MLQKNEPKERTVAIILNQNLFSWDELDAESDLYRMQLVLNNLSDEELMRTLETKRGHGRDTYPVRPMWNALIAGIVFQHDTIESLRRELQRNAELRQVCGFNPILGLIAVPPPCAMSRFVANVIDQKDQVEEMFNSLVAKVTEILPDFGKHLAFDGKAIPSFSTGRTSKKTGKTSDPDAAWGKKTYTGVGKDGKPWAKVKSWFGFQLHLIVDATYELPVAFEIMDASASETTRLVPMIEKLSHDQPPIVENATDLSADRGLDSAHNCKVLWDDFNIKPVIDNRQMWSDEKNEQGYDPSKPITRQLHPDTNDNIVYTERGCVQCVCPVSGTIAKMQFMGFEADRDALKFRCPAAAYGFVCLGRCECEQAALGRPTDFGRIVRVNLDSVDRRIFTPIPRDTPLWKRIYATRSSVERFNARIDQGLRFENHTIRGLAKMQTRMGLALVVSLAMAVGFISQGKPEFMRSLVGSPRDKARAA